PSEQSGTGQLDDTRYARHGALEADMGGNARRSGRAGLLTNMLLAGAAVLAPLAVSDANAGGLGLRDQSTGGEGGAFAGGSGGGRVASMFGNPATMTEIQGFGVEANAAGILARVDQHPAAGSTLLGLGLGGVNDTGNSALVPSTYLSKQVGQNFWVGLALNS